jgi:hypothetical protein
MIYTVIINSNSRISGTVANATYTFDWTNLPEGPYVLTWGFCSGNVDIPASNIIILNADLGMKNVFTCNPVYTQAQSSQILGTLIPNETGLSSFFYGDKNGNGPITLNRPQNNDFQVKLLTTDLIPLEFTGIGNYILNLSFEKV